MKPKKLCSFLLTISSSSLFTLYLLLTTINTKTNKQFNKPNGLDPKFTNIINCSDEPLTKMIKQRGDFYVLSNYFKAERNFRCNESITFTTPGDFRFLDNLIILVKRWQGPVSVALYTPGDDFQTTIDVISYLVYCSTPLITEYVSFHLFFEWYHMPKKLSELKENINCSAGYPAINPNNTYKSQNHLTYPINTARNIAKYEARTHFILASDIELFPIPNLINLFMKMIHEKPELIHNSNVFVLPLFEMLENHQIPNTKIELKKMISNKTAFIFHQKLCKICHVIPKYEEWLKIESDSYSLDVFTVAKRKGKHKTWEPFYIGTKNDPDFDERLTWEGQSNKMSQGYLMCILDYNYMILNNVFLVHKPGIKKSKVQLKRYSQYVISTNKLIRNVIKPELDIIYGTQDGCKL